MNAIILYTAWFNFQIYFQNYFNLNLQFEIAWLFWVMSPSGFRIAISAL